jgi:hypothetical protein
MFCIGRMHTVNSKQGERFYIRLLLNNIPGICSFEELYTYNGVVYRSLKEVCYQRALVSDAINMKAVFKDAVDNQVSSRELINLFVLIVKEFEFRDVMSVFEEYKDAFIMDLKARHISHKKKRIGNYGSGHIPQTEIESMVKSVLYEICQCLEAYDISLENNGIVCPDVNECFQEEENQIIFMQKETNFDQEDCKKKYDEDYIKMNQEQKCVVDDMLEVIYGNEQKSSEKTKNLFFIDAPGGTGKTFVSTIILNYVRSKGDVGLVCASSGIAATNFVNGKTAHSLFKIPINVNEESMCHLTNTSKYFKVINAAKLIIWDEAPMMPKGVFKCVDRTLRRLTDVDKPFGGKNILFCGDFRQVAPVVVKGSKGDVIRNCLNQSYLWRHIKTYKLIVNERIKRCVSKYTEEQLTEFYKFQLKLGEAKLPTDKFKDNNEAIVIPSRYVSKRKKIKGFIKETLGDFSTYDVDKPNDSLLQNCILTPKNKNVHIINKLALDSFPGDLHTSTSINELCDEEKCFDYPSEYLNSLQINGFPPHYLLLKIGAPVMVLRNLDSLNGICNGTRGIVVKISSNVIQIKYFDQGSKSFKYYCPGWRRTHCNTSYK